MFLSPRHHLRCLLHSVDSQTCPVWVFEGRSIVTSPAGIQVWEPPRHVWKLTDLLELLTHKRVLPFWVAPGEILCFSSESSLVQLPLDVCHSLLNTLHGDRTYWCGILIAKSFRATADKEAHQAGYYHLWSERNQSVRRRVFMSQELSLKTAPKEEFPRCLELWQSGCSKCAGHPKLFWKTVCIWMNSVF